MLWEYKGEISNESVDFYTSKVSPRRDMRIQTKRKLVNIISNEKTLNTYSKHRAFITDAEFSNDAYNVASIDVSGQLYIWNTLKGDIVNETKFNEPLFALNYSSKGGEILIAGDKGAVYKYNIEKSTYSKKSCSSDGAVIDVTSSPKSGTYMALNEIGVICIFSELGFTKTINLQKKGTPIALLFDRLENHIIVRYHKKIDVYKKISLLNYLIGKI